MSSAAESRRADTEHGNFKRNALAATSLDATQHCAHETRALLKRKNSFSAWPLVVMRPLSLTLVLFALATLTAASAQRSTTASRVPPSVISISEADRAELREAADTLGKEIESLRAALADKPQSSALLPDVQIFHKAVDWAIRYDEFYRSNEVGAARAQLKQGMERARQLRTGNASWLGATGLVVRGYVSKLDGSIQPYGLIVPASYNGATTHRLDVWLHGRDNNLTELKFIADRQRSYGEFAPAETFVLHPYGRYCNAFKFAGEVDVFEAMEHVKKSYRIDESRLAIRGFSMGGAGTWHLAAHYPNVWAAAAPGAGFAETAEYTKALSREQKPPRFEQKLWQLYDATDYAANFFNLPVIGYNGTEDPQRQAADMMERAMKAEGLPLRRVWGTNVGHKYTPEGKQEVSKFVDDVLARGRDTHPAKARFTTRTLRYNEGRGIRVDGLEKHWERANIELDATANDSWTIRTRNTSAFTINRPAAPRRMVVDGQNVIEKSNMNAELKGAGVSFRKGSDGNWQIGSRDSAIRAKDSRPSRSDR
jgi:predicted esterase